MKVGLFVNWKIGPAAVEIGKIAGDRAVARLGPRKDENPNRRQLFMIAGSAGSLTWRLFISDQRTERRARGLISERCKLERASVSQNGVNLIDDPFRVHAAWAVVRMMGKDVPWRVRKADREWCAHPMATEWRFGKTIRAWRQMAHASWRIWIDLQAWVLRMLT